MRNIQYLIGICVSSFLGMTNVYGQLDGKQGASDRITHSVMIGYNIGATAPFSLPNTIRGINSYSLLFTPAVSYEIHYQLSESWGIGSGLRFDGKGMKISDSVQYFHTIITMDDGEFEGDFTGTNQTNSKNLYLSVPIYGVYKSGFWNFELGGYVAHTLSRRFDGSVSDGYIRKGNSLGEKVLIEKAVFDFADQVKNWDWGIIAGANRRIGEHWGVNSDVQLGLEPIFPKSFRGVGYDLRNIYLTIGVSYNLGSFL